MNPSSCLTDFPFLPCDAMHKRSLCRHAVSVCVSVTLVDHVKTNKRIFKIFSPSGSQAIVVFPYQNSWHYSDGNFPNGSIKYKGDMKKWRFLTNISLYLLNDARQSRSYYGRQIGNCTQAFEWYQFEWPWLTSNPDFKVTILFNVK